MQTHIQGNNIEVTSAIEQYIDKKLKRLSHYDSFITSINFTLQVDHLKQIAEAQVALRGSTFHAKADAEDMYAAIDLLADRINRQLSKHKEKLTDHHRE
ncbi:MAG: ribosome-associated translation inhibitor RaiA [Gammaproteobacteria bacterium]|nr:ribosome-associated translation inhibitor RaiA [Gammaproteobacteria bacterium]